MNAPIRDAFDCSSRKPMRRHFVSGFPRALLSLSQEKSSWGRDCSIGHFGKYHNNLCLPPTFCKHCFQFLVGLTMVPRENKNNAHARFGGKDKEYYGISSYQLHPQGHCIIFQQHPRSQKMLNFSSTRFFEREENLQNKMKRGR